MHRLETAQDSHLFIVDRLSLQRRINDRQRAGPFRVVHAGYAEHALKLFGRDGFDRECSRRKARDGPSAASIPPWA